LIDEFVPGVAAMIDDVVEGLDRQRKQQRRVVVDPIPDGPDSGNPWSRSQGPAGYAVWLRRVFEATLGRLTHLS
jgi:hypothetical protein